MHASLDPAPVVNIAAYQFATMSDLPALRRELFLLCEANDLRGTVLLSPEGINLFVAGTRRGVDALLVRLRDIAGLERLQAKESFSRQQPFHRMLVKLKREIIAFGVPGIDPRQYTSRRVSAKELKRWLDEDRPITLLDTRNNFEVQAGTFRQAVAANVDDFRDFPAAVRNLPAAMKHQPVVTFCTGGIRCEKAAPLLEREGFTDVYQLDGGILKYLEECGGAHYNGHCFVFDQRVAVDASLSESDLKQCFVCQAIVSRTAQADARYIEGVSCPACFESEEVSRRRNLDRRRDAIRRATSPLPGSVPYDNVRPISVPLRLDGQEVLNFLDAMKTYLSRHEWRTACEAGRVKCRGQVVSPGRIVRSGERLLHTMPATQEPEVSAAIDVLHEDEAIVVVHKPAPLPMHPCGRFSRNSLSYILEQAFHPLHLRPAHRLDADTSGVVVFAKTRSVARALQEQFESGAVRKQYLARVHGHPTADEFDCDIPLAQRPGDGGVYLPAGDPLDKKQAKNDADPLHNGACALAEESAGARAQTRFQVIERSNDGTTLLGVQPLTGRTNQIRVHLWELGFSIVGDPIYLRDKRIGDRHTLQVADPPLCLHAAAIEFNHPTSGERVCFEATRPAWADAIQN